MQTCSPHLSTSSPNHRWRTLVPDLAGWRRDRMPEVPDAAAFELAPDWIAEVLSPATAATDRVDKLPIYSRAGVQHVWLLDPHLQTLEAFLLERAAYRLIGAWRGEVIVRIPPFDSIDMELGGLSRR